MDIFYRLAHILSCKAPWLKSAELYPFVPVYTSDPIFHRRAQGACRQCCWDQQQFRPSKQHVSIASQKVVRAQLTDWTWKSHCFCDKCPFAGCKLFHISKPFCCFFFCRGRILHSVWLSGKLLLPNAHKLFNASLLRFGISWCSSQM